MPFCKDRLLHIMKSIATSDDSSDVECYNYELITAETQYELMEEIFPDLQQYCTIDRLQYWVDQSSIWGPRKRKTTNGQTKYGRHLWIVRKEMREFLVESTDSIQHIGTISKLQECIVTIYSRFHVYPFLGQLYNQKKG